MTLPPGQRVIAGFPRFGTHFHRPPPAVPANPAIAIAGAGAEPVAVPVADLARLPRREIAADFHCVAGWSAENLRWEGVAFSDFYRTIIEPRVRPGASISHIGFVGLDGYRSVVLLEDALGDDVVIADRLNSCALDGDHGAPVRLVSPSQYGFISTKHLCRIELHTSEPAARYHPSPLIDFGLRLVWPHARARVWEEERHRHLPAWLLRPIYRRIISPIRFASGRGGHQPDLSDSSV
ncbi:MAG: molybdopterin-dependent oxidoreductase [Actinobacteria bacterium]|nr:molybdopterin-dependent oxidoreductase [Actinomycetota bacterium]